LSLARHYRHWLYLAMGISALEMVATIGSTLTLGRFMDAATSRV
jgi:hypothetical protein